MKRIVIYTQLFLLLVFGRLFADSPGGVKGMIVFAGLGGKGNGSFIYAISPDGKEKRTLATGRLVSYPAVSPDGNTVVFSESGDDFKYRIYAVDGSGEKKWKVAETTHDAILASWSPDGKRIAFLDRDSDCFHTTSIYLVNPDGTGLTEIVKGAQHDDDYQYPPLWSKDGKSILYDKKDAQSKNDTMPDCLFIVHTDGSGEIPFGNHNRTRYDGYWSPDNSKVAYYSQKNKFDFNKSFPKKRTIERYHQPWSRSFFVVCPVAFWVFLVWEPRF